MSLKDVFLTMESNPKIKLKKPSIRRTVGTLLDMEIHCGTSEH